MKEKYCWSFVVVIMLFIVYGAYLQIRDFKSNCVEISREESQTIYNPSKEVLIQTPVRIQYQCSNGLIFTR